MSSACRVFVPTCQTPLTDPPGGYGLLAPQMPMLPTPSFLAEVTTSGCSRTSLAQELTCPLSSMSLAHEPAQKMSSTSKACEPACHTSLSYSRERSRLLAPMPIANGAQTPMLATTYCLSSHHPPPSSPTGQWGHYPIQTPLKLGEVPPWRHAVLWNAVASIWHPPCLNTQDLLMQIHG